MCRSMATGSGGCRRSGGTNVSPWLWDGIGWCLRLMAGKAERASASEPGVELRPAAGAPAEGAQAAGGHAAGGRAFGAGRRGVRAGGEGLDAGEEVVAVEEEVGDVEGAGLGAGEEEEGGGGEVVAVDLGGDARGDGVAAEVGGEEGLPICAGAPP